MIRIIVLAAISLNPVEIKEFLASRGLPMKVEVISLSERELGTQKAYYYKARAAFLGKAKHTVFISDAFDDSEGNLYTLGNTLGNFSHVACTDYNAKGEPRKLHCLVALAHEIGHQRGLKHSTGCVDIMDSAALACPNIAELRIP